MMEETSKKTYYISVARGEISQSPTASPWEFKIEANDGEIIELREYFDQMNSTSWQNFFRAHVPYVQYHLDKENEATDQLLQKVYTFIFQHGDEEAKEQIHSMGILKERD